MVANCWEETWRPRALRAHPAYAIEKKLSIKPERGTIGLPSFRTDSDVSEGTSSDGREG